MLRKFLCWLGAHSPDADREYAWFTVCRHCGQPIPGKLR